MVEKVYQYAARKHVEEIEYRRSRVYCEIYEGSRSPDEITLYEDLSKLLNAVESGPAGEVSFLTGHQIGLVEETVAWAESVGEKRLIG